MSNVKTEINDAIALAKAVRTAALMNAKVALTEQFNENYKALFAEKLKNEAAERQTAAGTGRLRDTQEDALKESDIDELIKELESDIEGADASSTPTGIEPSADAGAGAEGAPEDVTGTEPTATATPAPEGVTAPPGTAVVQAPVIVVAPEAAPEADAGVEGAPEGSELPPTNGAPEEDVNLDELLESLKKEIEKDEEKEENDECITEDNKLTSSGIGGAPGKSNKPSSSASSSSKIETTEDVHHGIPEGEIKVEDATTAKRPNAGPVNKNKMATPKLTKEGKTSTDVKVGFPDAANFKTVNKGNDPTETERPNEGPVDKNSMDTPKIKEALASKDKTIKEQSDAINYLKNELNEINLLNVKLLFTNRLFKEHNMNSGQKRDIIEMFDLAKTIREVKMNYASASKFLGISTPTSASKKSNISAAKVQAITEGLDRNIANSGKTNQTAKEIISENSYDRARFQELAGIKLEKKK